jgi:hypothetical protein
MAIQRSRLALLALLLCLAEPCHAQTWHADSSVRQFAWGPVNVLVIADSNTGTGLWAGTSSIDYHGARHEFRAWFNPESLITWLDQAHAVVFHDLQTGISDSIPELRTVPLMSADSSQLVLLREREKSRWDDRAKLVFLAKPGQPLWSIAMKAEEANALLEAMFVQGSRSHLKPAVPVDRNSQPPIVPASSALLGDAGPTLLSVGRVSPPRELAGVSGEVWLLYLIGTNGEAEPGGIRVMFYSNPGFVDAAIRAIQDSRFTPGMLQGIPVRTLASQRVTFHGGRRRAQTVDNFPRPLEVE